MTKRRSPLFRALFGEGPLREQMAARQASRHPAREDPAGVTPARLAEVEQRLIAWRWPHEPADVLARYRAEEAERAAADAAGQFAAAYCTKHMWSGRRLVNTYGGIHLTPGPECDGGKHRSGPLTAKF